MTELDVSVLAIPWHSQSITAVAEHMKTDINHGLLETEAIARLKTFGANRLKEPHRVVFWRVLIEELLEPMMLLLLATALLYSLWGNLGDAIAIIIIVTTVVFIEIFTEYRAKVSVAALSKFSIPTTSIIRDSQFKTIPTDVVVPGDVVVLHLGQRLAADLRLIETISLGTDESALTGESVPVDKNAEAVLASGTPLAERQNMAFAGTIISGGYGRGIVVATGMSTQLGQITGRLVEMKQPYTPLQIAMRSLAKWLSLAALAFSILIPLLGWSFGQPWREMILTGLMLAFATIPEELPIIVMMLLGLGAYRLSRRHIIVKRLRAAEILGIVSVIAMDKTGTLTVNKMTVTQICIDESQTIRESLSADEENLLKLVALCHDASIMDDGVKVAGDPIEVAILTCANRYSVLPNQTRGLAGKTVSLRSFDFQRKIMSVVYHPVDKEPILVVKGAPESVVARCTHRQSGGFILPLNAAQIQSQVDQMAADGLRVIAVGLDERWSDSVIGDERNLVFIGLIGVSDPIRPEAAEAIAAMKKAGIRVIMITGDHPITARVIAQQVGLDDLILTGDQLDEMDDDTLSDAVVRTSIFARLTSEHKLRIVTILSRQEIVAVTGDGINDAPALAEAQVGIAMGECGTDIAREAADLVLADDNFATIVHAIEEARTVYANLRKGVSYYLACKLALISTVTLVTILQLPFPFSPIQIVVMETFMDVVGSSTFTVEPAEYNVMSQPSRDPSLPFVDQHLIGKLVIYGGTLFAAIIGVYLSIIKISDDYAYARTMTFTSWMVGYLALAWVMRSDSTPLYAVGFHTNKLLPVWTILTITTMILLATVPALRDIFRLEQLSPAHWAAAVLVPLFTTSWLEISKIYRYVTRKTVVDQC